MVTPCSSTVGFAALNQRPLDSELLQNITFNRLNVSDSVCLHEGCYTDATPVHTCMMKTLFFFLHPVTFNLTIELSTQIHWIYFVLPQGKEPIENIWDREPLLKSEVRGQFQQFIFFLAS